MVLALVLVVVVVALAFDYTNGFHDAANAIATSVSTRALTPRAALVMAGLLNFAGAFLGQEVALTIGSGIKFFHEIFSPRLIISCLLSADPINLD